MLWLNPSFMDISLLSFIAGGEKKIPKTTYSSGSAQFSLGTEESPFEWSQL